MLRNQHSSTCLSQYYVQCSTSSYLNDFRAQLLSNLNDKAQKYVRAGLYCQTSLTCTVKGITLHTYCEQWNTNTLRSTYTQLSNLRSNITRKANHLFFVAAVTIPVQKALNAKNGKKSKLKRREPSFIPKYGIYGITGIQKSNATADIA
jgi:hypothetical protein